MITNRTLTMIKPDAVENGHIGAILGKITASGFKIIAIKMTRLTRAGAETFYGQHKERPFYSDLVDYMTSGPIVAVVLEKENAVEDFRALIGSTNPEDAAEGTIRKMYAESLTRNSIHGSDSNENAALEIAFHFSQREIF